MKKNRKNFSTSLIIIIILIGIISGAAGALLVFELKNPQSKEELIKEFYEVENAVHVSPHGLRKSMETGADNFILVDLRSSQEYETAHIIGAVNIPAYSDPDTSDYGAIERITGSFKELKEANPGKDIIVYCYSTPCMTGRKIGKMLADEGIYVKHLGIGWNEWRYHWTLWNHELEWEKTDAEDYIISGSEPGKLEVENSGEACPIQGSMGC